MIPVPFQRTVYHIAGVEFIAGGYPGQVHVSTLKGYCNISKVLVQLDNPVKAFSRLRVLAVGGKQELNLSLEDDEARRLEHWLKGNQVTVEFECNVPAPTTCPQKWMNPVGPMTYTPAGVVPDEDEDEVPERMPAKGNYPVAECPECYGTGFHKGFGAPCSKGCKTP